MKKVLFLSFALFGMISWVQVNAQKYNSVSAPQTHAKAEVMTASEVAASVSDEDLAVVENRGTTGEEDRCCDDDNAAACFCCCGAKPSTEVLARSVTSAAVRKIILLCVLVNIFL